jgi:quinol-cytochrome oxidoreductase complex cytochrome b subunit
MSGHSTYTPKSGAAKWLEARLPIIGLMHGSFISFPTPRNLNYFWTFGAILMVMLVSQIVTGIILAMHYVPNADMAFQSVEHIRRDVNYGWLIQRLHAVGASMFFIAVYIHMFRGMYYGSYKAPREVLWILGVVILLLMMATAFMGYVLPWGQMSGHGTAVITGFFSAIPLVGENLRIWILGSEAVDNPALNRFFSLHYLMPFMITGVVILHVWALHHVGQNNPTGVDIKNVEKDTVPFTPYATLKDLVGLCAFMIFFFWFVFFMPDYLGHADNYIPFDPLKTPAHIVPEWYFLPFYGILRAITFDIGIPFTGIVLIDSKLGGVLAMFGSIAILAFLPWLDTSRVRSGNYRPTFRLFFWAFVIVAVLLGYVGSQAPDKPVLRLGETVLLDMTGFGLLLTIWYFAHFLIILPVLGLFERTKPLPISIADSILSSRGHGHAGIAGAHAEPNKKG